MPVARNHEPVDWREGRRLRAWELHQQGWSQVKIAEALGVTQGAVSQWFKRATQGGLPALHHRPVPGAPARLSEAQRHQVLDALAKGAPAFDFIGDVWTTKRIAALIKELFGVSYHPAHVSRLMRALRQSVQVPATRATQRDEGAIAAWQTIRWPEIQKKRWSKGAPSSG